MDVEYPDIPLGGWAGTIREVLPDAMYTVRWSRETLTSIHPIYKRRCNRDGINLKEYWLADDDLEPDPGGPLAIQQPAEIRPRPLSFNNQRDRVQMIFGRTSDDSLPEINKETLITYRKYLFMRLRFPFHAIRDYGNGEVDSVPIEVVALVEDEPPDEEDGILCEVVEEDSKREIPLAEMMFANRNSQLVQDYRHWFVGELADAPDDDREEDGDEGVEKEESWRTPKEPTPRNVASLLLNLVAFGASYGAFVGSAVAVMPWAKWAAYIGGGLWGAITAAAGIRSAHEDLPGIPRGFRKTFAALNGLCTGAISGAFFGILLVGLIGAVLGTIAMLLLRPLFRGRKWSFLRVVPRGVLFGPACGVVAQALYLNRDQAIRGLGYGALAGLGTALVYCLLVLPLAKRAVRKSS